jgi:adenosylcobinamide-GDP ribazoletransferase
MSPISAMSSGRADVTIGAEARLFVHAAQLLTRLPTPRVDAPPPDALARSAKYFPLVGEIVGGLASVVFLLAGLAFTGALPALLAVAAGIAITGAFHEDGLADTADGLGGGLSRSRRLEIMKDSRIGTYGALALGLSLAIKILALAQIAPPAAAAVALIAAHGGGRAAAVAAMAGLSYAGDVEAAKLKPVAIGVGRAEMLIAIALTLPALLFMRPAAALAAVLAGCLAALWPALMARRLIGGYTGDILGAIEQAFEAGFLVGAALAA